MPSQDPCSRSFSILNGLTQLLGGTTNQWALYVLGQQKWVVVSQWATVVILALTGAVAGATLLCIRRTGGSGYRPPGGTSLPVGAGARLGAPILSHRFQRKVATRSATAGGSDHDLAADHAHRQGNGRATVAACCVQLVVQQGLLLAVDGVIFLVLFLVCLRVIRPLEAEDAVLLAQAPPWLRRVLMPLVAKTHLGKAALALLSRIPGKIENANLQRILVATAIGYG